MTSRVSICNALLLQSFFITETTIRVNWQILARIVDARFQRKTFYRLSTCQQKFNADQIGAFNIQNTANDKILFIFYWLCVLCWDIKVFLSAITSENINIHTVGGTTTDIRYSGEVVFQKYMFWVSTGLSISKAIQQSSLLKSDTWIDSWGKLLNLKCTHTTSTEKMAWP
jgi:hypothetical protein